MKNKSIVKLYNILECQPKVLSCSTEFAVLKKNFLNDPILNIHIKKKIFNDFNKCRIRQDKLRSYLNTNKLPLHPFFPKFLILKQNYINSLILKKKEKKIRIEKEMSSIPIFFKNYLKYFLDYEKKLSSDKPSVFIKYFIPKTYKKTKIITQFTQIEWFYFFERYIELLSDNYIRADYENLKLINYKMVLNLEPLSVTDKEIVIKNYRKLALIHHPDKGGCINNFKVIQDAKINLLKNL